MDLAVVNGPELISFYLESNNNIINKYLQKAVSFFETAFCIIIFNCIDYLFLKKIKNGYSKRSAQPTQY